MLSGVKSKFNRLTSVLTSIVVTLIMLCVPYSSAGAAQYADNELKEKANEIAFLINEARAENGLPPVYVLPYLNDKARERSREAIFCFAHKRPDGSGFSSILDTNLVNYSFAAENLAAGNGSAAATFEQWRNSPSHWNLIMKKGITHIGVGCSYEENSDYKWYWQITFLSVRVDPDPKPGDSSDIILREQFLPTKHAVEPKCSGDVNGDGVLDVYDYVTLVDFIRKSKINDEVIKLGTSDEDVENNYFPVYFNDAQWEAADCFVNTCEAGSMLTESDAKALMKYLLGEQKELPYVYVF